MNNNSTEKKHSKKSRPVAAAIKYTPSADNPKEAPRVTASGKGAVAKSIVELAKQHNVPIEYNPALANALMNVDLMAEIPQELFMAVAEIIASVCDIEEKMKAQSK